MPKLLLFLLNNHIWMHWHWTNSQQHISKIVHSWTEETSFNSKKTLLQLKISQTISAFYFFDLPHKVNLGVSYPRHDCFINNWSYFLISRQPLTSSCRFQSCTTKNMSSDSSIKRLTMSGSLMDFIRSRKKASHRIKWFIARLTCYLGFSSGWQQVLHFYSNQENVALQ